MTVAVRGDVEVFYVDPAYPARPNEVVSFRLVKELVSSLSTTGWDGPPVVVLDRGDWCPPSPPLAITGSHRLAAADQVDIDVPCVDLYDLFALRGLDLDDLLEPWLPGGEAYSDEAVWRAVARQIGKLPIWLVRHYDIVLNYCWASGSQSAGHYHMCELPLEHELDDDDVAHRCVTCGVSFDGEWPS